MKRFSLAPGVTTRMITQRYEMWAAGILKNAPHFCLEVRSDRGVEGWFLSSEHTDHAGLGQTWRLRGAGTAMPASRGCCSTGRRWVYTGPWARPWGGRVSAPPTPRC